MIIGIVAVDRQGAIGKGGKLPWHYSADMKFFRETTTNHACVMGHNTWLTLRKPLANRLNIVLSRQSKNESQPSLIILQSLESVLSLYYYLKCDLFVMGGAKVYREFMPYIEKWIVTEIPLTVEGADTFMPPEYLDGFNKAGSKDLEKKLTVKFYERRSL